MHNKKICVGIVGLGARGRTMARMIAKMEDVFVKYICDIYPDRVEKSVKELTKFNNSLPIGVTEYSRIMEDQDVEAVLIFSSWESHLKIALDGMRAGKYVGMEVGGAYHLKDCFELVAVYEETGIPCMMLENCCYGKYELTIKNMVEKGMLGEIVHCSGGYHHDLRKEIAYGLENRHYRLRNYIERNCENYPTHELGPISKILKLNKGNLMTKLYSASSKASGLKEYIREKKSNDYELCNTDFLQGDIVTTTINCLNGETIVLTLDTTLPRSYSRAFTVRGTKGMYQEDCNLLYLDNKHALFHYYAKPIWNNARKYINKNLHPIWQKYKKRGIVPGHGGMDYLVIRAFFEAVHNGTNTPIDVYDTASWMSITPLSEQSIRTGTSVDIPDFTKGKWKNRAPYLGKYSLD